MKSSLILLICLASTLFMTGLIWFVDRVHYPLFDHVGDSDFRRYHAAHVRRITPVVLAPMMIELLTSLWLVVQPPKGVSVSLMAVGLALAITTWGVTAIFSVPMHNRLALGFDNQSHRSLVRTNLIRALAWSAHSALLIFALGKVLP